MIRRKDYEGVTRLAKHLKQEMERAKMEKCMSMFHSVAICKGESSFYVWAQVNLFSCTF